MQPKLSKRAEKVYERVKKGQFYRPWDSRCPKAMQELVDAGLVKTTGRVAVVVLAYVPSEGYTPYEPEKYAK